MLRPSTPEAPRTRIRFPNTKSVTPTIRTAWDWVSLRLGPLPLVVNGIRLSIVLELLPALSRTVTRTASLALGARASVFRPVEVSLKYRIPVPFAAIDSVPVVAIVVRPAVTVVITWQGLLV